MNTFTLQNGFKTITHKDNSNPLVCLQLYIRTGSTTETKKEAGFSHFTEHLVFKSTESFKNNSIMEQVTFAGGSMNAYTEYDSTCFYLTLPSEFIEKGLQILSEIAYKVEFLKDDFLSEKKVVIEELKQYMNDPEDFFVEEVAKRYLAGNPYSKPIIGTLDSLTEASISDLQKFYKKHYFPGNSFLVVTGDFQTEVFDQLTKKYFAAWDSKKQKISKSAGKTKYPIKPEYFHIPKKIRNDILAFVFPDLAEANPKAYPLSIASKAFGIGKNSMLYKRLFSEEMLIDTIRVHSLNGINEGALIIVIMPKKKANIQKIIDVFCEELDKFQHSKLSDIDISQHKKELLHFYKYSYEYVESLASGLGSEELTLGFEEFEKYPTKIRAITKSDIDNVIKKYFAFKHLNVFHIGKKSISKDAVNKSFESYTKPKKLQSKKKYVETKYNSGSKLLLRKISGKPTVGISISFEVSQMNEHANQRGLNLVTSGMLLYGNKNHNYQQFVNYCTSNGINFGVAARSETTTIRLKCFKEALIPSLELLSDVISTPSFPKDQLGNMKQSYASNLSRIKDYPDYYASQLWKEMIFGKTSNLVSREGTVSNLRKISKKKIEDWFSAYYLSNKFALAVVGDINLGSVQKTCEKLFLRKESKVKTNPQIAEVDSDVERFRRKKFDSDQSVIHLGGFGCTSLQPYQNTAFHVLAQIIGGDTNSIFFRELREKRGLGYSVDFDYYSNRLTGIYAASVTVDKKREEETLNLLKSILANIKDNGISKEDLEKTKNYIRGQRLMEEESVISRAQTLSVLEATGFGYEYFQKRDERLKKVTLKSLKDVAAEYFNEENFFIHVLS